MTPRKTAPAPALPDDTSQPDRKRRKTGQAAASGSAADAGKATTGDRPAPPDKDGAADEPEGRTRRAGTDAASQTAEDPVRADNDVLPAGPSRSDARDGVPPAMQPADDQSAPSRPEQQGNPPVFEDTAEIPFVPCASWVTSIPFVTFSTCAAPEAEAAEGGLSATIHNAFTALMAPWPGMAVTLSKLRVMWPTSLNKVHDDGAYVDSPDTAMMQRNVQARAGARPDDSPPPAFRVSGLSQPDHAIFWIDDKGWQHVVLASEVKSVVPEHTSVEHQVASGIAQQIPYSMFSGRAYGALYGISFVKTAFRRLITDYDAEQRCTYLWFELAEGDAYIGRIVDDIAAFDQHMVDNPAMPNVIKYGTEWDAEKYAADPSTQRLYEIGVAAIGTAGRLLALGQCPGVHALDTGERRQRVPDQAIPGLRSSAVKLEVRPENYAEAAVPIETVQRQVRSLKSHSTRSKDSAPAAGSSQSHTATQQADEGCRPSARGRREDSPDPDGGPSAGGPPQQSGAGAGPSGGASSSATGKASKGKGRDDVRDTRQSRKKAQAPERDGGAGDETPSSSRGKRRSGQGGDALRDDSGLLSEDKQGVATPPAVTSPPGLPTSTTGDIASWAASIPLSVPPESDSRTDTASGSPAAEVTGEPAPDPVALLHAASVAELERLCRELNIKIKGVSSAECDRFIREQEQARVPRRGGASRPEGPS